MDPWEVSDVTSWAVAHQEPRGKRPKCWVQDAEGRTWLRKEPRESRPNEPAIEALVLRLARCVGLEAPMSRAATWTDPLSSATKRGIVVEIFTKDNEELSLGSVELKAAHPEYDPEKHGHHTLDRVRSVLDALEPQTAESGMVARFAQLLAFDAWVGNSDRHQENWGVIRVGGVPTRLAPMFDPAACLGAELGPTDRRLDTGADLSRYIAKCPSGFGDGEREKPLLSQGHVVTKAAKWPEWKTGVGDWLARFDKARDTFVQVAREVPEMWLPRKHSELAMRLLEERLVWLKGCAQ